MKIRNAEYDRYIHSAAWRMKANERMELDNHTCQVCGEAATDVHHLTYDHFENEEMEDLVSLCRRCHNKAEEIYDPSIIPWAMDRVGPDGNNFMAAMRVDAAAVAPVVFYYLKEARGISFDDMMRLRQPDANDGKKYWVTLRRAVDALCRKRYSLNCVEDRRIIMTGAVTNHVLTICLQQIEHWVRNRVQADLHETVSVEYMIFGKWKEVAEELGITDGMLRKFKTDDGTSFGPSLRETVLYYCGLDAAAGIPPVRGFRCLTTEDYEKLDELADYMVSVSGTGSFKGEYEEESK